MSKPANVIILTALLSPAVPAQTPSRFRLDSSDAAFWGGLGIGTGISAANPKHVFQLVPNPNTTQFSVRDSGSYPVGRQLLIGSGIWGAIRALQFAKPNHRGLFYWSKIAAGATFAAIGAFRDKNQSRWIGPTSVTPIVP